MALCHSQDTVTVSPVLISFFVTFIPVPFGNTRSNTVAPANITQPGVPIIGVLLLKNIPKEHCSRKHRCSVGNNLHRCFLLSSAYLFVGIDAHTAGTKYNINAFSDFLYCGVVHAVVNRYMSSF